MKSTAFYGRLAMQLFAGMGLGVLITGCAFTRTPVKVEFSPSVAQSLNAVHQGSLEVGEVKDSRTVTDPLVLLHKANEYGATSGAYVTEVPVGDIFREGLEKALKQNGFVGNTAEHYVLRSDLQGFGFGVIQTGLFTAPTAKPWLEVRFELDNKATGQPVWHDTYTGKVTDVLSAWNGADGERIASFFSLAATDAVKQLIADKAFRSYFEP
jgi:hypothetical protein